MRILLRVLLGLVLLVLAIASYSYGFDSGMIVFIIMGFSLEMAFWFNIFPLKKRA